MSVGLSDLAGLAALAQSRDPAIRPVILRLQARAFAGAPTHGGRAGAAFEALACGLLPLVTDDVAAEVAAILSGVPDLPPRLRALLTARGRVVADDPVLRARTARLSGRAQAGLLALDRRDVDRALARNADIALDARATARLVERAAEDPALAGALLDRPEPGLWDRAALYGAADSAARDALRARLAATADLSPAPARLDTDGRLELRRLAEDGAWDGLLACLGRALAVAPAPAWRPEREGEAELFALALVAVGLDRAERNRILLTAHPAIARSARLVRRLDRVAAGVAAPLAARLVGAGSPPRRRAGTRAEPARSGRSADGARALSAPAAPGPDRAATVPAGRRSRATTGPDRT